MILVSFFVAGTVVTLLQFLRLKDKRLLPLLALFALAALGHSRADYYSARPFHIAGGAAGLVLLVMLSPRHPRAR